MRVCAEESFAGEPFGTAVEGAAAAAVDAGDVAEADIAVAADAVEPHSTDSSVLQPPGNKFQPLSSVHSRPLLWLRLEALQAQLPYPLVSIPGVKLSTSSWTLERLPCPLTFS